MSKTDTLLSAFSSSFSQVTSQTAAPGRKLQDSVATQDKYQATGATKSRMYGELPVDQITTEGQPREIFDEEELQRLAQSIRKSGQLAPIRVRWDVARMGWVLVVGERRLRACRLAGITRIRVEFVEKAMDQDTVLVEQIIENAVRADLRPLEAGRAYKRLMELTGWTVQQISDELGIEPTSIYRSLSVLSLPDEVKGAIDAGDIRPTAAYELSKLENAEDQREVARKIIEEDLGIDQTVAEVNRREKRKGRGRRKATAAPKDQKLRGSRGVRVVIKTTARHTPEDVLADLLEIAEKLRPAKKEAA